MSVRRIAALAAALVVVASMGVAAPAVASPSHHYYVSLGDSLAFGFQPNLFAAGDYNSADYRGYAEDFASMHPGLTLENFSCPGETTWSMLGLAPASSAYQGCYGATAWPVAWRHTWFASASSQEAAALAFLQAHQGEVSLITVDIGSNDLLALVNGCNKDLTCIGAGLASTLTTMGQNYGALLAALRAAAPNAQIVLFNIYDPYALSLPGSDVLTAAANGVINGLASTFHARVADAYSAMNHKSGSPSEGAFLCTRTWMCSSYTNIHPTTLGYRMLAVALQHAM